MKKTMKGLIVVCACAVITSCVIFLLSMQAGSPNNNVQPVKAEMQEQQQQDQQQQEQEPQAKQGYRSALYNIEDDTFLVAGTGGRLDKINSEKVVQKVEVPTTEDLLSIGFDESAALIVGTGGTILYTEDGKSFIKADSGTTSTLFGVTAFNGKYYVCGEQGILLSSFDCETWTHQYFSDKKDIISIAATDDYIMAVTRESDFYISADGINWSFQNFNEEYNGYYEPYIFKGVRAINNSLYVFGQHLEEPDYPLFMRTDDGRSWMHTPFSTVDTGEDEKVVARLNEIAMNTDQFLAICDGGRILTITDCASCHKLTKYADMDLYAIAVGKDKLLIAGDGFGFDLLDSRAARQYNIKAEQAYEDYGNGAIIIDVRTEEEYNGGHIKGSLHIPVDKIEEELPKQILDLKSELIFYCAKGGRSQTALETALTLGYERVYNLGAFSDWPYETE